MRSAKSLQAALYALGEGGFPSMSPNSRASSGSRLGQASCETPSGNCAARPRESAYDQALARRREACACHDIAVHRHAPGRGVGVALEQGTDSGENPGLSIVALRDKIKAKLTLAEAAEADAWWSKLRVVPR